MALQSIPVSAPPKAHPLKPNNATFARVEAAERYVESVNDVGVELPIPGQGKVNDAQEETGRFWAQPLFETQHGVQADLSHPFPAVNLPSSVVHEPSCAG